MLQYALAFFVIPLVARSFGDFIVARHPPTDDDRTRNLTCISDDDHSALIWNYNHESDEYPDFQPEKVITKEFTNCALYNASTCYATWENTKEWKVVDSVNHPMSTVSDYRWEGFREFFFDKTVEEKEYHHVRELNGSSSTVIFSARGQRDISIILCENEDPTKGPCISIIIGSSNGQGSEIWTCDRGAFKSRSSDANGSCKDVARATHKTTVIDIYTWRTFRIQWKMENKMISVFRRNKDVPFLNGNIDQWHPISHILLKNERSSRVRFHFYEYLLTEEKGTTLSTSGFIQWNKTFCVEMLVGMCLNCNLEIQLVDRNGVTVASRIHARDTKIADKTMLSWQNITMDVELRVTLPRILHLIIKSGQNTDEGKGQWAIDNFRTCQPDGSLRKSTITIHREIYGEFLGWPRVDCQKLSYDKSAVINTLSRQTNFDYENHLQNIARELIYESSHTNAIGNWSLCDSHGCTCSPGFRGMDCNQVCLRGYYGYGCKEACGFCHHNGVCDPKSGYCSEGCSSKTRLPPLCQRDIEFARPIIMNLTDSTVRVLQRVEYPIENAAELEFGIWSEEWPLQSVRRYQAKPTGKFTYEAGITNLKDKCDYTIQTIGKVTIAGQIMYVTGPEVYFTTKSWCANTAERCLDISQMTDNSVTVNLDKTSNDCADLENICGPLEIKPESHGIAVQRFPTTIYNDVSPGTKLKVIVSGFDGKLWTRTVHIRESAPGKVDDLSLSYVSDIEAVIRWKVPKPKNGIITKYIVSIERTELRGCIDLKKTPLPEEKISREVYDTTIYFSNLHPYAKYIATVVAYTSEAGPEESHQFETHKADIPTSSVSKLKLVGDRTRLEWEDPEDCNTISGSVKTKKLVFVPVSQMVQNQEITQYSHANYFDLKNLGLASYTLYRVRVYIVGGKKNVNETLYQEEIWRTLPSAPPAVRNLEVFDADPEGNSMSLRWEPPNPPNGEIELYTVVIKKGSEMFINSTIEDSKGILMCEFEEDYVCFENLNIPPHVATDVQVQVTAQNKDVREAGIPFDLSFTLDEYYNEAPGMPRDLSAIDQSYGTVMLTWVHPSHSTSKITKFRIVVEILKSDLLDKPAVNRRNISSDGIQYQHSVPQSIGFANDKEPQVKFDGTFVTIDIPKIANATQNTTLAVIVRGPLLCMLNSSSESSSIDNMGKPETEWYAAEYQIRGNETGSLLINVNNYRGINSTCSLDPEKEYTIVFSIKGRNFDIFKSFEVSLISRNPNDLAWLAILPVLATCVLVLALFIWKRNRNRAPEPPKRASYLEIIPLSSTTATDNHDNQNISSADPEAVRNMTLAYEYSLPKEPDSCCVSVEYFEEYAKNGATSGLLYSQFMLFRKGLKNSCDYGSLPENLSKNRNSNQIAYDDTRVVLQKIPGDPHSDYINASYIEGYKQKRAYIAAQGPMLNTVNDFWRMIWQEEVQVICMLTNVIEGTETKCEQYWPEVTTTGKYGNLLVTTTYHQVFADYTFRTFLLDCKQGKRQITHLHYTGWPASEVPVYPQSLVAYLKKMEQTPAGNGPVVVHCSTGDDRTGTIILCHICLRQAAVDREINVTAVTTRMRESRANMVSTLQQYVLAHIIMIVSMMSLPTQIPCTKDLSKRIKKMKMQLPCDIQRLNDSAWQEQTLHSLVEPQLLNANGNHEVVYSQLFETKSRQFHAIGVDSVKMKKQYLSSWLPSPLNLSDFWEFVTDKRIKLIIILQCSDPKNPTCFDIIPADSAMVPLFDIQVKDETTCNEEEYFTQENLIVTNTSQKKMETRFVTVLSCRGWERGENSKPPTPATLVSLWMASEKIPREAGQTLVLCHNGIRGCGLYLALSFLLERMAVEKECDVISAVRAVRRSKSEFVRSLEEFEYLYNAAVTYAECFQTYANFT